MFFRRLAAYGWRDKRCAVSNEFGSPLDEHIALRETALADKLRKRTFEFLSMYKDDLNSLCDHNNFYLIVSLEKVTDVSENGL